MRGFARCQGMVRTHALPLIAAALLAACSQEQPADEAPSAAPSPATTPAREFRFTSLADCPLLESNPEEAGYFLYECPGESGYALRVIESDLRQTVEVVAPGGERTGLELAVGTGGGFSELGDTVEWRGTARDGVFAPDALILRHAVVTDPEGRNEVSDLVAVALAPAPCVIARIAPGPGQNEQARQAADAGGECMQQPN